jgi:cytochrome c peroxidase
MRAFVYFLIVFILIACGQQVQKKDEPVSFKKPSFFPAIPIPNDNSVTKLKFILGRYLFYDKALSADGTHSCSSCHVLSNAFTDGKKVSLLGNSEFPRNAPTLANVAWQPYLMSEGGVPSLEMQLLGPIHEAHEFASSMEAVLERLGKNNRYNELSHAAFGRDLDAYTFMRALATFERGFISGDTKFDRSYYFKSNEMNEDELAGQALFFSERAQCSSCHALPFFTDYQFYSLGLEDSDLGLERRTYQSIDRGKFKTPTLRNIELTAPYMHNGSLNTLADVVRYLNEGGGHGLNKDARIQNLSLTEEEQRQLISFLKCLTDWNFVQNADLVEPDDMNE